MKSCEKSDTAKKFNLFSFSEEVFFLISCNSDTNHEGKIDYIEFVESYYDPAKSIGFNLAVLFTNLSEHMPSDARLAK